MDVAHIREVSHPSRDASQHAHQLDDGELTIVFLRQTSRHISIWVQCVRMKGIYQLGLVTLSITAALHCCICVSTSQQDSP